MSKKIIFSQVVEFANQNGMSVERHSKKGFRCWTTEYPMDKHRNHFNTLTEVQQFIEREVVLAERGGECSK